MLKSLNAAISGLQNFQTRMDVIGNNIANVNTIGYKAARTDFSDAFSQTLRQSSSGSATTAGVAAMQIGSGMSVNAIKNLYTQGSLQTTGLLTDLAIDGEGFFMVKDQISGEDFVTRAGNFRLDKDGFLITQSGQRVQGYTGDPATLTAGDIRIAPPVPADFQLMSYTIAPDGVIKMSLLENATQATQEVIAGQILVVNFKDPQGLIKRGNNLYSGMDAAGASGPLAPGSAGVGKIQSGNLEMSNVGLADEFSNMITAQRAFQATARVITTSDEMLQELVNLKR